MRWGSTSGWTIGCWVTIISLGLGGWEQEAVTEPRESCKEWWLFLERTRLENWCQGILGKSYVDGPLRLDRLWRYLYPIWISTSGFPLQSRLLTRWTRLCGLWLSVSFFPKTQCFLFGLMNKVAMVAGMGVMHGLSNVDSHSSMLTSATAEYPICQHQKPMSLWYASSVG